MQSWVRGVVLEMDGGRLSWGCSEDEGLMRINDNIQTSVKYMNCLLFKRLYAVGLALHGQGLGMKGTSVK